jgi:hypothetical protein
VLPAHEEAVRLAGALGLGEAHLDCLTKAIEAARRDGAERVRPILEIALECSKEAEKKARWANYGVMVVSVISLLAALSRFL